MAKKYATSSNNKLKIHGLLDTKRQKNEKEILDSYTFLEALSLDCENIYLIDCVENKVIPQRLSDAVKSEYGEFFKTEPRYDAIMDAYIASSVVDSEKEEMKRLCTVKNIKEEFKKFNFFLHDYRGLRSGKVIYCRVKAVALPDEENFFILAFSNLSETKGYEFERLAYVDPLTGGNNYNYFKKQVREVGTPGYLISMDIHQFKLVNSICGVAYGDRVLKRIWEEIEHHNGKDDISAHVYADHFVIFTPLATKEAVLEKLNTLSERLLKLSVEMRCPRLNPYFGIAKWDSSRRVEEAYSFTTIAKHGVKESKDVNYLFYSKEDSTKIIEEKTMEDEFPEALANNHFEVWYQPKFSPTSEEIVGAEALVRWRKSSGQLISPGKFIPVFEKTGLIRTLDEYVFDTVCRFIKDRIKKGERVVPISVNLSRASLYYEGVVDQYTRIAQDSGISPKLVPIEITETAAVSNSEIKEITESFRENGFPLCMDDFGTGYSSLALLNVLHFDNLKIDKTLVDGITEAGGKKLIKHVIALSKDLGMTITAEGVESEEQKNSLQSLNCDSIQGFYYKPPLPKEDFSKLLLETA